MLPDSKNLELIPTDDLIFELKKRFDFTIFMGRKFTGGKFDWETKRRYFGDIYVCAAMADNLAHCIHQAIALNEIPHDGKGT